jgi:diguanylate cyclase
MDTSRAPVASPALVAKAALRRLALAKLEPTPENYARAYAEESGGDVSTALPERARVLVDKLAACVADDAAQRETLTRALAQGRWDDAQRAIEHLSQRTQTQASTQGREMAGVIERIARGLERGGRTWTTGRKKDSLQRVLDSSRSDAQRLLQRLRQLVTSWDSDSADEAVDTGFLDDMGASEAAAAAPAAPVEAVPTLSLNVDTDAWDRVTDTLQATVRSALPEGEPRAAELADLLAGLRRRIAREGATPEIAAQVDAVCERARRLLGHHHTLVDGLRTLCHELTTAITELAEDDSWARGQCEAMQQRLADGITARSVRSASELLAHTRERQHALRAERDGARDALKAMINRMLSELGELGTHTGRFQENVGRYADVIEGADSLESLAGVVREMVEESRSVQALVAGTQQRLNDEHARATELAQRVEQLEGELRRLSDEVSTDPLTQIANRRGLMQAFEAERARIERAEGDGNVAHLAIGLLDIDNFKKLNDSLGHAAGDEALKALAAHVRDSLRPVDAVSRFGGEEFVVLLPGTPVEEGQQVLTRLQRQLSASLFMHQGREVFVTFSAGVTAYRIGETIEQALDRADEALYEAKRTGKNRTCIG